MPGDFRLGAETSCLAMPILSSALLELLALIGGGGGDWRVCIAAAPVYRRQLGPVRDCGNAGVAEKRNNKEFNLSSYFFSIFFSTAARQQSTFGWDCFPQPQFPLGEHARRVRKLPSISECAPPLLVLQQISFHASRRCQGARVDVPPSPRPPAVRLFPSSLSDPGAR